MRKSLAGSLTLCCFCFSSPSLAQPVEIVVPAPPVVVAVPCPAAGSLRRDPCLKQLLELDPRYRAARSRRNAGIVLTSVGGAVGLIVATAALASYQVRETESAFCWDGSCRHNDYTGEKIAAITGATLFVVSVAVGIPTIVSGAREMRLIRDQHLIPVPAVSVGPGRASFGATWRF